VRTPIYSGQFKRDVKKAERRGKDLSKLRLILRMLIEETPLPPRVRDHPLRGSWRAYRDLHIEPDWLLIYRIDGNEILFERTGTHSDLFES
jgi:mRNA interferase YafQ